MEFVNTPGFQVYVLAPLAVSVVLCPAQMVREGVTVNVGVTAELTVTVNVASGLQPVIKSVP